MYSGVPSSASPCVLALSQMTVSRLKQCMQNFPTLTNVRAAENFVVSEICARGGNDKPLWLAIPLAQRPRTTLGVPEVRAVWRIVYGWAAEPVD